MSGYARFHRSLVGHPAFRNDAEAMAFAYMVLRASWKATRVRYKERAISLNRGQLSMSQRDMAAALDRDKAWVERLWKRLRDEAMIEVVSEAGVAVITICNYDKYQHSNDTGEAADEAPREARARQGQGTEQVREEYKKEEREEEKRESALSGETAAPSPARKSTFPRPEWADPQVWADLLTNRSRKKLANTPTAHRQLLKTIADLSDDHWPPGRLLEACVAEGWGAVFASIKTRNDGTRNDNRSITMGPRRQQSRSGHGSTVDAALAFVEGRGPH